MYYQRLLYRQFTNHFISGICDIYNLSVGTNSYTERMIEQRDIRTAVFIALHARKSDRSSYHSSIQGQFGIDYSYTIVTTISDIQFTVFGKADLMGIIKLGIPQQTVFPSCSCYLSFQYGLSGITFTGIGVFVFTFQISHIHSPYLISFCHRDIKHIFLSFDRAESKV